MDYLRYSDHCPLDTSAQRIYLSMVEKYGWDISCKGKFAPLKLLYAKCATQEGHSVWFVAHSNLIDKDDNNGKWKNTFEGNLLLEEWLPEGINQFGGEITLDNTKRVIFAKKKSGHYYFMGVYEPIKLEKLDNGNILKTYEKISSEYPFDTIRKPHTKQTDKVKCLWGENSPFSREVIAHFILLENPEYKECIEEKVTSWFECFNGSEYEDDVITTRKYLGWFNTYFQHLGCDSDHVLPYIKELLKCFDETGDALYDKYLCIIGGGNKSLNSMPYLLSKKDYFIYCNQVFTCFIPLTQNLAFDYERAIKIIQRFNDNFSWITKYEFNSKWKMAFCLLVDLILGCGCSIEETSRKSNYDLVATDFLKNYLSFVETDVTVITHPLANTVTLADDNPKDVDICLPKENILSKSVPGHFPDCKEKLIGKTVMLNIASQKIEVGTVVDDKDNIITIITDYGKTKKFKKTIALKKRSIYIVDHK